MRFFIIFFFVYAVFLRGSFAQTENGTVERIGGDFKVARIDKIVNGFRVHFKSKIEAEIPEIILISDHIHARVKEGDVIRLSADVVRVEGKVAYASQVLVFLTGDQGEVPVWMTATGAQLIIDRDFLKMHSPSNDYFIL